MEASQAVLDALVELKIAPSPPDFEAAAQSENAALRTAAGHAAEALGLTLPAPVAHDTTYPALPPISPEDAPKTATLFTTKGRIDLTLRPDEAPHTVANFARLARRGFYNGQLFHRVVPDFVAQGGDPRGDGWGGPGYTIRCEIGPLPYTRGAVGMALSGKDTGGSQFFITHTAHPHLDGGYTVFGALRAGGDVLDALTVGDRIVRVDLQSTLAAPAPPNR